VAQPKVVHISVIPSSITLFTEYRQAALERIFGQAVEVIPISPRKVAPGELARQVRELQADAVVFSTGPTEHLQAVERLAPTTLILRPVHERARNNRGEMQERFVGFGVVREGDRLQLLDDGALSKRSAGDG
jgi:hypothetical protein